MLRDGEGTASRILASHGVELEGVVAWIGRVVGRGSFGAARDVAFTPRAKSVVQLSVQEAVARGDEAVDTEHMLLALTRLEDGLAARIMVELGAEPHAIADAVVRAMPGAPVAD